MNENLNGCEIFYLGRKIFGEKGNRLTSTMRSVYNEKLFSSFL